MVMTQSTMLELGSEARGFELPDVTSGEKISLESFAGEKGLLVMFISRHCPYVIHVREELARIGRDFADADLGIAAIASNDPERYPDDAPPELAKMAAEQGFVFPLLFDETQEVAKSYTAACTPDFFLFDGERRLVYRGQLDDSRPGNDRPVTGADLRRAIERLLAGEEIPSDQKPSMGCNIKWRPGNEPGYFG